MRRLVYKTDAGCRKGCHPVNFLRAYRREIEEVHAFSIDEPGAWWDDEWNCHVDGTDYPFATREEAIRWGAHVLGYDEYVVYYEGN